MVYSCCVRQNAVLLRNKSEILWNEGWIELGTQNWPPRRYHFMAYLHITETRSILFLTKYDKINIIVRVKTHSKTGFSVNDWKSSKTLRRLKLNSRSTLISGCQGELFSKWEKLVYRSAWSQSFRWFGLGDGILFEKLHCFHMFPSKTKTQSQRFQIAPVWRASSKSSVFVTD